MSDDVNANVYLMGDSAPVPTSLTPEGVAARLAEATDMMRDGAALEGFVRLPHPNYPDALVRVGAVAAILPSIDTDDDDDDD